MPAPRFLLTLVLCAIVSACVPVTITVTGANTAIPSPAASPLVSPTRNPLLTPIPRQPGTPSAAAARPSPTFIPIPTGPLPIPPGITFKFDEGVSAEQRADIQKTVVMAHQYFGDVGPVTVLAEADLDLLIEDMSKNASRSKDSPESKIAKQGFADNKASAMAQPGAIAIWVSEKWKGYSYSFRLTTIAHEYFHVTQQMLSKKDVRDMGALWLVEGSADFAKQKFAETFGLYDVERGRLEIAAQTKGLLNPLIASETESGSRLEDMGSPYRLGYLATELLSFNYGNESPLRKYWQALATARTWQAAFQTAFGISVDEFYREFETYRRTQFPPYCGTVRSTSEDPSAVPFAIQFHRQHAPGSLPFASISSSAAPNIPYTFCVQGFLLSALTDESKAYKLPEGCAGWTSCGGNCIVLYMKSSAPPGDRTFAIELPDGRRAATFFQHGNATAAAPPAPITLFKIAARAAATPPPQPSAAQVLGTLVDNKIAFVSTRDGNNEIYVMNADGSRQTRLTFNDADDQHADWSPDGAQIVFQSERDGNREIYKMNADGSQQIRLTNNRANDQDPNWSPDGRRIVFVSGRDGNNEIYVMNADGSQPIRLTNTLAAEYQPDWSPDGKRISFVSNRDGDYEIYAMDANGSNPLRLTQNAAEDTSPAWSPDGTRIAFSSTRDGNWEVYLMNASGSGLTRLTNNWASDDRPVWSPDGTWIAVDTTREGGDEIYLMDPQGSRQIRVTDAPANNSKPAWQPKAAVSRSSGTPLECFERGKTLVDQKRYDEAITEFTLAIQKNSKFADAFAWRARAYYSASSLPSAQKSALLNLAWSDANRAIEIDPSVAMAYIARGVVLVARDAKYAEAIAEFTRAIGLDPGSCVAFYNRGLAYHYDGNLDQAAANYSRAIELDSKEAMFFYNRGVVYRDQGRLDQAIADLTQAIALDPRFTNAFINRGLAYRKKGNLDHALADYTQALKMDPGNVEALTNRGNSYLLKGNVDLAIADYNRAIEIKPDYGLAFVNRGIAYRQKGLNRQALADFQKYLVLAPNASNRAEVEQWIRELGGR